MKVTPLDIRRKEFKRSVRGYADEEVDLFLDEVADEFERLHQESSELQERLRRLEEQLVGHQQLRDALEKTLVSAQLQADETRANARKESELILRDAELKARGIISDSYSEVQKVEQALIQLKRLEEDFRFKFQSLLEGHLKLLAEAPINLAAPQQVSVEVPVMDVLTPIAGPATGTPFVIPTTLAEVPEFPPVAATTGRTESPAASETAVDILAAAAAETPAPVATEAGAVVEPVRLAAAADFAETLSVGAPTPVGEMQVTMEPPAALVWPDDTGVIAVEETATSEQGFVLAAVDTSEDQTSPDRDSESPTVVSDESVTLVSDQDPLRNFFFAPTRDGDDGDLHNGGRGGKSKPRDFEW